jgi:hypothetical protein
VGSDCWTPKPWLGSPCAFRLRRRSTRSLTPTNRQTPSTIAPAVDLLLLGDLAADTGGPTLAEIHATGAAPFRARADEAQQLGLPARTWPPTVVGHAHWGNDYKRAADLASIQLPLDAAVAEINAWIGHVDRA